MTRTIEEKRANGIKPKSTTLTYPLELRRPESDYPYMQFEISEYIPNIPLFIKDYEKQSSKVEGLVNNIVAGLERAGDVARQTVGRNGIDDPINGVGGGKRLTKANIILPITNNIVNSLGVQWSMDSNPLTQATLQGIGDVARAMNSGDTSAITSALSKAGMDFAKTSALTYVNDIMRRTSGAILNPRLQALFNGVDPRSFNFDFIFTPTSEKEAETVEKIIETLTKYALPEREYDSILFKFPHEYFITFHNVKGFPKLNACVLQGIATNYTPNSLQLLKSGHAVQIILSMSFLETTVKTQDVFGL